ncbi:MAG: tripartite tricarboxylate transporter TctB family protein [Boseongicola sp. SB0673_bin_14]|nr:tripartite tricarboxylate transporter TctB family protein [Boseongicola sp. SB0673_bin_14]
MNTNWITRDVIAGALILAIGLAFVFILIPIGVDEPRRVKYAALSPTYYPRIVAMILVVIGAAVVARAVSRPTASELDGEAHPKAARRLLGISAILAAFAILLTPLGFVVASALALFAAIWLAGEQRIHVNAAISVILPVLLYFFFLKVARSPIPLGVLKPVLEGV